MWKWLFLLAIASASGLAAAELSERWQKKLDAADSAYKLAIDKVENAKFYATQKATTDRVKFLKQAMSEATKAGDLDAANEIKARMDSMEAARSLRARPIKSVKLKGHTYALIEEQATWHVAKRICEEMGGHLATVEAPDEDQFLLTMCRSAAVPVWMGATDEVTEDKWLWLDGKPVEIPFSHDNSYESEHYLVFWPSSGGWDDNGSARHKFVCEWDN